MNNYLNNYNYMKNYSQIKNNNYKQPVNNFNNQKINNTSLYDPYQGEQAELLTYIDSLSFACIDLNLYLDVNPNDRSAIDLFNQYKREKKDLIDEYQNKFGPLLLNSDGLNTYPWAWNDRPWPWES